MADGSAGMEKRGSYARGGERLGVFRAGSTAAQAELNTLRRRTTEGGMMRARRWYFDLLVSDGETRSAASTEYLYFGGARAASHKDLKRRYQIRVGSRLE